MKGDIAVAGFRMTAEEWQALDRASRSELVAVITRRDEVAQLAAGSGPIPLELEPDPESGAIVRSDLAGADSSAIAALGEPAADVAVVALMCRTEVPPVIDPAAPKSVDSVDTDMTAGRGGLPAELASGTIVTRGELAADLLALMSRTEHAVALDSGPVIMIITDEGSTASAAAAAGSGALASCTDAAAELDFGAL